MTESYTWLITGTSRGLGLEIVRQLLQSPTNTVIAACRAPEKASSLQSLKNDAKGFLHVLEMDTSNEESIEASATRLKDILGVKGGVDYLINNAGLLEGGHSVTAFNFSASSLRRELETNVVGHAIVAKTYLPFVEKGKRKIIVNMTSGLASIGSDSGATYATYSLSKTALNMLTTKQAKARPDFICFCVDPGWVKTDMGGKDALLEPHESVSHILKLVTNATSESSGQFLRYDGKVLPW
ncbi:hypothetical protein QCA50_011253 [Cerrena zonata]|uniref:NAD(P)-binding protein n=1 Tax=Cerrena zonata TaxID=2478898 RepID=A0AAW0G8M9_9APHY